jgi:hypothetical protein
MRNILPLAVAIALCAGGAGCASKPAQWYETIARTAPPAAPDEDIADRLHWDPIPDRETAMRVLLRTDTFTDLAVAGEGVTPAQLRSFAMLLDEPDAPRIFRVLLRHADAAGQMFALCGLYLVDRPFFDGVVGRFRSDRRRLYYQYGCFPSPITVAEIVQRRGPAIHIPRGQEAAADFYTEWAMNREYIDIVGGGWPEVFRTAIARMNDKGEIVDLVEPVTDALPTGSDLFRSVNDEPEESSESDEPNNQAVGADGLPGR